MRALRHAQHTAKILQRFGWLITRKPSQAHVVQRGHLAITVFALLGLSQIIRIQRQRFFTVGIAAQGFHRRPLLARLVLRVEHLLFDHVDLAAGVLHQRGYVALHRNAPLLDVDRTFAGRASLHLKHGAAHQRDKAIEFNIEKTQRTLHVKSRVAAGHAMHFAGGTYPRGEARVGCEFDTIAIGGLHHHHGARGHANFNAVG